MNYIIIGPQGSGKGTQAKKISEKLKLIHIDMGKALRQVAKLDSPLGKEVHEIINVKKELVSKRIAKEVLHLKLGSIPSEQGIVFDGVPRSIEQKEYLGEALRSFGRKINKAFFIKVSPEESFKRVKKRWACEACKKTFILGKDIKSEKEKCPGCRGKIAQRIDDTKEGLEKRLKIFEKETMPMVREYEQEGVLVEIDGEQTPKEVFEDILAHATQNI